MVYYCIYAHWYTKVISPAQSFIAQALKSPLKSLFSHCLLQLTTIQTISTILQSLETNAGFLFMLDDLMNLPFFATCESTMFENSTLSLKILYSTHFSVSSKKSNFEISLKVKPKKVKKKIFFEQNFIFSHSVQTQLKML